MGRPVLWPDAPAAYSSANAGCDRNLVQTSALHVVDEAPHARLVRYEGAGFGPGDRLFHIVLEIRKRLQGERRPDADLRLDLLLDVVILEGQHPAIGVMDQDDLVRT